MSAIEDLLKHAHAIADVMGKVSACYFYSPITIDTKKDKTFVTQADLKTEKTAREYLDANRPHDRIWGEEFGTTFTKASGDDIRWVIDPIDGTKAFMDGLAYWANLIGVFRGEELLFGIINQPITGERYWGGPNLPSRYSYIDPETGKRIETLIQCADVASIELLMWRSTTKDSMNAKEREAYNALAAVSAPREGGDAMLYAALARGRTLNCVFDANLALWDIAAPAGVVLGAKGVVSDITGQPIDFFCDGKTTVLAAATKTLHKAVLAVFSQQTDNRNL